MSAFVKNGAPEPRRTRQLRLQDWRVVVEQVGQDVRIDEIHLSAHATRRESIPRRFVRPGWSVTGEAGFPAHGACVVSSLHTTPEYFRRTAFTEVFSSGVCIRARSRVSSSTVMVRFMMSAPARTRHQHNTNRRSSVAGRGAVPVRVPPAPDRYDLARPAMPMAAQNRVYPVNGGTRIPVVAGAGSRRHRRAKGLPACLRAERSPLSRSCAPPPALQLARTADPDTMPARLAFAPNRHKPSPPSPSSCGRPRPSSHPQAPSRNGQRRRHHEVAAVAAVGLHTGVDLA